MAEIRISPASTDEEAAAIAAAVEEFWPKPTIAARDRAEQNMAWRLSGRWWQRDFSGHRDRPWS